MRLVIIPKDDATLPQNRMKPQKKRRLFYLFARQLADRRRATSDFGENLSICHGTRTAHVRVCLPTSVGL